MRAFRFRLETVVRVREHQERVAAERLALAARDLRLAQARRDETRTAARTLTLPEGRSSMAAVLWTQDQSARMAELVRRDDTAVAKAEVRTDEARRAWVEAERRCRSLRRLEQRKRERWQYDADRAVAAELDDMATARVTHVRGVS